MKEKGYNNQKMAEALTNLGIKISADAFKQYKAGKSKPRMEVLEGMAEILGVFEQDFFELSPYRKKLFDQKYLPSVEESWSEDHQIIQVKENVIAVPMIYAGAGSEALADLTNCEHIYLEKSFFTKFTIPNGNIVSIKIVGDSMEPQLKENDILLVELIENRPFAKTDGVYLIRYGDVIQIKKVQFLGNGEVLLISLNKDYPPVNPSKDHGIDYEILGKPFMKLSIEHYSRVQYIKR
jgi:phage repressor protein C with HTH and peptisase S24 domain